MLSQTVIDLLEVFSFWRGRSVFAHIIRCLTLLMNLHYSFAEFVNLVLDAHHFYSVLACLLVTADHTAHDEKGNVQSLFITRRRLRRILSEVFKIPCLARALQAFTLPALAWLKPHPCSLVRSRHQHAIQHPLSMSAGRCSCDTEWFRHRT